MKPVMMILLMLVAAAACGQDMRENAARSLFADQKASRIGDAVTILVVETSTASNDASTTSSRQSNITFSGSGQTGSSSSLPQVGLGIGTTNDFKGSGATSTNGNIRAKLSARIDSVFANGNLWINGTRTIIVNGEEQTIKISGLVRPSDIAYDNSVYSFNIADARISFEGNGIVSRAQGPGWITKLLHWLF
ncbi:MAG TPA: flagellar basal body L-ring protein FlgH [Bacteroidota bacterium]|nr:flagellar basal body L-ring protein FlgH [Bacteroidota bacterium]